MTPQNSTRVKTSHMAYYLIRKLFLAAGASLGMLLLPVSVWCLQWVSTPWSGVRLEHDFTWRRERAVDSLSYTLFGSLPDQENFTQSELSHLRDVGKIIWIFWGVTCCFILAVPKSMESDLIREKWARLRWLVLAFLGGLALITIFFFPVIFASFHLILFPQGNFSFPVESTLIQTFPPGFWLTEFIAFYVLVCVLIIFPKLPHTN